MPEPSLEARALNYLARREYSRAELHRKLQPHAEERDSVEALLDQLEARGYLSEQRFVEQLLHARSGRYGSRYIAHELREKGVGEDLIEQALPQLKESEPETARAVWARKFGALPLDARERAKQMRFLMSRGFAMDVIGKLLSGADE